MSNHTDAAIAYLKARMSTDGVASAKVKDGEVFMFSLDCLQRLMAAAEADPEKAVTVFVKTGPNFSDTLN